MLNRNSISVFLFCLFIVLNLISCNHSNRIKNNPIKVERIFQSEKDEVLDDFLDEENMQFKDLQYYREIVHAKSLMKGGVWTKDSTISLFTDSLNRILKNARFYGLQPEWYHLSLLDTTINKLRDSSSKNDLSNWVSLETIATSAFLAFCNDVHFGIMKEDSIDQRLLRGLNDSMASSIIQRIKSKENLSDIIHSLEPKYQGYSMLKDKLHDFVPGMDLKKFTFVGFPWRDSITYVQQLKTRLKEIDLVDDDTAFLDSISLSKVIRKAQLFYRLKVDGKFGQHVANALNNWDQVSYARMALNLDRYRLLPDCLGNEYVFVNIPSASLKAVVNDSIVLRSKVIVGNPKTTSPVLNGKFLNLVLYPQWTVPYSIVFKEIVPKMNADPDYLRKQNMFIVDKRDSLVDPGKIKWTSVNVKNFHYQIRQGEGLDNSLGVLKFNFANKYSVYLHDTNARHLFANEKRMLSHGCIRVEKWLDLANFLLSPSSDLVTSKELSVFLGEGKRRGISLKKRTPLYIRYFTWYEESGSLKHFEDAYGFDNYQIINYMSN